MGLVLKCVQTRGTHVQHAPVGCILLQERAHAHIDTVEYAEVDVIRVAELLDKALPVRHLQCTG